MSMQHVYYNPEATYGTFAFDSAGDGRAILVESFNVDANREILKMELSGSPNRARLLSVLGAKPVSGQLVMPFWQTNIKSLFKTALKDVVQSVPVATVYDDAFLFDDTALPDGISFQTTLPDGTGKAVLGAVISKFTIAGTTKEPWKLTFDFEAKDEGLNGANWDYNGAGIVALQTAPAYPTLARPFMFYDSSIGLGDSTPTETGNKITVGDAVEYANIRNFEVACDLGIDTDGYGMTADPTRIEMVPGNRVTTVKFEISWSDYAHYFYDIARLGYSMAFQAVAVGQVIGATANHNEAHVVVPAVVFDAAKLPPIDGSNARKFVTVEGEAISCPEINVDFNLWIRSAEATI